MHCMANMSPEGNSAAGPYRRPPERRGRGTCSSRSGLDVHLFCSTGGAVEGPPLPQLLPAMQASAKLPGSANIFRCPTCSEHPVNITDFGRRNQFRPPLLNAAGCMQNSHMRRGGSSFMLLTKAGVRLSSRRRNLCSLSSNLSGRYLSAGLTGIVNLSLAVRISSARALYRTTTPCPKQSSDAFPTPTHLRSAIYHSSLTMQYGSSTAASGTIRCARHGLLPLVVKTEQTVSSLERL